MEIWFILLKMLGPQRAGWMWAEFTTKLGWMGCLCSVTSPRSKHLEQNESYFHNLHMNWVSMGYITSVELFMDLKPRIYEVWACMLYLHIHYQGRQYRETSISATSISANLAIVRLCNRAQNPWLVRFLLYVPWNSAVF